MGKLRIQVRRRRPIATTQESLGALNKVFGETMFSAQKTLKLSLDNALNLIKEVSDIGNFQ